MAIVNLSPVLDSLTGTTGTPATFRAVAMRAGRTAVRVAGPSVTFPTQLVATWDGYGWDANPTLHTLPADCYWNVKVAAAGNRLERNAILPSTDGVVDFADLIDVTPDTGQPDTSAVAQWAALQQYIGNQAARIDGVAATIFGTVATVQAQIDTATTATAQAAAAAADAVLEQAALATSLAGVTTSTQAATDAALQAAADRAAADADAAQTAADRAAVAGDRAAVEGVLDGGTVQAQIDAAVNALVNGAPGALDTLKELADAIGDDANFAATVTNALASKANLAALAAVAFSGAYSDLTGRPVLGTAAVANATEFDPIGSAASAQSIAIQRVNHTGTQSADTLTDGTTNKAFLATERTKLAGIAAGATANRTDSATDTVIAANTAVFSVKSYGATGDGTTDDTTAVQAALTAAVATAGRVLFPTGTYLCGTLTITGDITVQGAGWGSTVKLKNATNGYLFTAEKPSTGAITIAFSDLTLDGNAGNQTAGGLIDGRNAQQSTFDRIRFTNAYDACLWLRNRADGSGYGHHNRVTRCLFDGLSTVAAANQQGIRFQSSDENYVAFCDFENWGGLAATPGSEPYAIKDWSGLQQIVSNVFVGGQEAVRLQDCSSTRIIGNTFDGNGRAGVHVSGSKNVVLGNLFSDGSGASGAAGAWAQLEIDNSSSAVVGSNIFSVQSTTTVRNSVREYGTSSSKSLVSNNVFDLSGSYYGGNSGIELHGASSVARNNIGITDSTYATTTTAGIAPIPTVIDGNA